jgi:hypothetical protein
VLVAEVMEGDIALDELIAAASADQATAPLRPDFELFRVSLSSAVSLHLGRRKAPLMTLDSRFSLNASKKGDVITAGWQLAQFAIQDYFTRTALFTNVVQSMGSAEVAIVDAGVTLSPSLTVVTVKTQPLQIVYNRGWVAELIKVFKPPPEVTSALVQTVRDPDPDVSVMTRRCPCWFGYVGDGAGRGLSPLFLCSGRRWTT